MPKPMTRIKGHTDTGERALVSQQMPAPFRVRNEYFSLHGKCSLKKNRLKFMSCRFLHLAKNLNDKTLMLCPDINSFLN